MADFADSEAVSSEEEEDMDHSRKKKTRNVMMDSDEEEDDEEETMEEELKNLIDDAPIEEDINDESDSSKSGKQGESDEEYDDRLEDDDYDLIEENLGITVERKRYKRLKRVQDKESDEEHEHEVSKEREIIANELFENGSEDEDENESETNQIPQPVSFEKVVSEAESSDADDFIVDDEGRPISEKRRNKRQIYSNPALQQAQDIFGIDFDFEEFEQYDDDESQDDNKDDDDDDDEVPRKRRRTHTPKRPKKTIFDIYEPSELKRGHFTDVDNEIRDIDIPERMQLRSIPVTPVPEGSDELHHESEWIYQQAFNRPTISVQNAYANIDFELAQKGPEIIPKIKKVLEYIRNLNLEVPFISFYRKEFITPELNMNDLWKIYKFDAKWCVLRQRRENLIALFEKMRDFQLDEIIKNPDAPLSDNIRVISEDDIDRVRSVQTSEELNDVYRHFMLYYSNDVPAMRKVNKERERQNKRIERIQKRQKQLLEEEEIGEDPPPEIEIEIEEADQPEDTLKQAVRFGSYEICVKAGLNSFAKKFGLSPEYFAENVCDNYQRHEVEQEPVEPNVVAQDYIGSQFKSSDEVLKAVQLIVAIQLARNPLLRKCVREMYMARAKLTVKPTKKGIKEIDENHPIYTMKYLKDKAVSELTDDQYLKLSIAEEDKLINIMLSDTVEGNNSSDYIDEIKQFYVRDEFSKNVQIWNELRMRSVEIALTRMIIPDLKKELRSMLLNESNEYVMRMCCKKMYNWIKIAPYSCQFPEDEDNEWDTSKGIRVMGISYTPDYSQSAFGCIIAPNGLCTGFLKLPHLLKRKNSFREEEKILKEADLLAIRNFILAKKPHVIVIGGESREALMILNDIKECLLELTAEEQFSCIQVEILETDLAKINAKSTRVTAEFREYPEILREAISLARRIQDPLVEFAQLCTPDQEILCLKYHSLQDQLPKEELLENLYLEFINRVNEVGFDMNRANQQPHYENLIQFVCGLGPRKGQALIKTLKQTIHRLENRTQLITACHMGPKIFINCAGFIKIDTDSLGDSAEAVIDVLDGSRVHPETYEWARKMAVDALEEEDPAEAMEEILKAPERLKELDLDAFAEELERQGCGNKSKTLYDIRAELSDRYKDLRTPYQSPTPEELFNILTKETPETFYIGKLVLATVIGMSHKKPDRDQLDQANPVRNEESGMWQCPFCLTSDFAEMSEVWNHFDVGSCPGKANGVRLRLENGMSGYIHIKNLSDSHVENPEDRVKVGQVIHCRIIKIDVEKFSVECSSKGSDLADQNNEWRPPRDPCYDVEVEKEDIKLDDTKKVKQRQAYVKRLNFHPLFHNMTYVQAQKLMQAMKQGDAIIRPSSKGSDHLTVTWKIADDIYQHIDVKEEGKENIFSLGRRLYIGNEEFEDLDEIIARHINPMASYVFEMTDYKKYKTTIYGDITEAEKLLKAQKEAFPKEIPYFISAAKNYPGKFMLSYLPRVTCRHEYVSVTPEGFRYRNQMFGRVDDLIRWFKKHCFDPIPSRSVPSHSSMNVQTPSNATPGSISNMDPATIARVAQNLPHDMLQTLTQAANPMTHPSQGLYPSTPYTPSGQTPYMTPYQTTHGTPENLQSTPRYGQAAPHHQFSHPGTSINHNMYQGIMPSSQSHMSMNNSAEQDQFDWQTVTMTEPTGQRSQQKSTPYSRRTTVTNNSEGNSEFDWESTRSTRPRRQNMHQRPTPYSRQTNSTNNAESDNFDWGTATQTEPPSQNKFQKSSRQRNVTNDTSDSTFDWGTATQAEPSSQNEYQRSSRQRNVTNDTSDSTFDWGTVTQAEPLSQNEFQRSSRQRNVTNDTSDSTLDWGTATQTPPINRRNSQTRKRFSGQSHSTSNDGESFDWGTVAETEPSNKKQFPQSETSLDQSHSTSNAGDDTYDWGTGISQNTPTDNTTNAISDWQTDITTHSNDRDSYRKSTPWSRHSNTTNNTDHNASDWGTDSRIQSRNNNGNRRFTPYSRRSGNNSGNDSSQWRGRGGGRGRGRSMRPNMRRGSGPSPYRSNSKNNADDNTFDRGTGTQTQSRNQNEPSPNTTGDGSFDWGTVTQPQSGNQQADAGTHCADKNTSDWQTDSMIQSMRQNLLQAGMPPPRPSPPRDDAGDVSFDWGSVTLTESTSQNDTTTNDVGNDEDDRQANAVMESTNGNKHRGSSASYSRYSYLSKYGDVMQSDWQSTRNTRPRYQNAREKSMPHSRRSSMNNANNNSSDWGKTTQTNSARYNKYERSEENTNSDMFDWGTVASIQLTSESNRNSILSTSQATSRSNEDDDNWQTGIEVTQENESTSNNINDWDSDLKSSVKNEHLNKDANNDAFNRDTSVDESATGDGTPLYDEN